MDPLSVSLAVITLATAVKDMIELAEKISASFEKVSDNLRNAQVLANDIKRTVYELKEFCKKHFATLDEDAELRGALVDLIGKMKFFHSNTVPLIPARGDRLLNRVKSGIKAWKNNNKIEASILELKEDVKKCQDNFMMMAVARMEVKLAEMQKSTKEGLQVLQQGVSGLLVAAYHPGRTPSLKAFAHSSQAISAFAETSSTTSAPMLKSPDMETSIIRNMYLQSQVHSISQSLSDLAHLSTTYTIEPLQPFASPFAPMVVTSLRPEYCDPESLHRDVVQQSLQIRKTLQSHPTSTSIQEGAWSLVDLSIGLHYLNMPQEAADMGKWAVDLFRALAAANCETYSPFLVHSLKHLSHFYSELGDSHAALLAIQEAVDISRTLQHGNATVNVRVQYSAVLTICAKHVSQENRHRGTALARESLKLMEEILDIRALPVTCSKDSNGIPQVNQPFVEAIFRKASSHHAIVEYARALRELSDCLVRNERIDEALEYKLLALSIFSELPVRISESLSEELGGVLYDIITQPTKKLLPLDRRLAFAEDYIRIVRKRVDANPSLHGRSLCNALWEKASILNQQGRHDKAVAIWTEIADLAQSLIRDQLYYANALSQVSWSFRNLKRHEDAAHFRNRSLITYQDISGSVSPSQAYAYYDLCIDLQLAKRYDEAAQAARNAISQSRALALHQDPHQWTIQVGRGNIALANSLLHLGDLTAAMGEGLAALQVLSGLVSTDPSCVGYYLYALRVNLEISMTVNDAALSISRFRDVIERYRQLAEVFPGEVGLGLLEAEIDYGHNLDRLDRLSDARQHFETLLNQWDSRAFPGQAEDQVVHLRISTLISYASILDNQAETELALVQILKASEIGKPFCAAYPEIAGQTVGAMFRHAQLLVELGRYQEAMSIAEEALAFSKASNIGDLSNTVGAMHVVAIAADRLHSYERVIEVSKDALAVCRSAEMLEYCQTDTRASILLPRSLQFLSSGEADLGLSDGLQHAIEAVNEAEKLQRDLLLAAGDAERSYMDAKKHLGTVLLAEGELIKALEIFEPQINYLRERVKQRIGEYGDYVVIMYRLGIIYCHMGRHAEGEKMAQELSSTTSRLQHLFPGLYRHVLVEMRHEISIPSLKNLQLFRTSLLCCHQTQIFT